MAFGQPMGPPAGQRQIERLRELLSERGFDSFREARHRLGLTQRQANGRFSIDEADELIERLEAGSQVADSMADSMGVQMPDGVVAGESVVRRAAERRRKVQATSVVDIADDVLADELVRRGWCCIPPPVEDH